MHKMIKIPLGGIMLLIESLEERNVILTMDELKTGNITSARTGRGSIHLHWEIENRQFRQTVLRLLKNFTLSVILSERVFTCVCPDN